MTIDRNFDVEFLCAEDREMSENQVLGAVRGTCWLFGWPNWEMEGQLK